jgi:hypothetical protein
MRPGMKNPPPMLWERREDAPEEHEDHHQNHNERARCKAAKNEAEAAWNTKIGAEE